MKFLVGVTDNKWFDYLSHAEADEVNFWHPSGKAPFSNLEQGAPFLFKLKRPFNHIAGGGYFLKSTTLPLSMAWDAYGEKNGASSRVEFEKMIRSYTKNRDVRDPEIGCTLLTAPFFWSKERWIADPIGWSKNIVTGKLYNTNQADGSNLWALVQANFDDATIYESQYTTQETSARYGEPVLVKTRLGQGGFRVLVTDAYQRRCAITGESTLPVLEAAHIQPFAENGPNEISNGMLLRSDFHKLFDNGFVTVTPDFHVEVSPRIREEWFNGKAYYSLHGKLLANVPIKSNEKPSIEFLRWHNENRFQG